MEIKEVPLSAIKPYHRNPRKNDSAVNAVARSIQEFGFRQPIVVDKDGVIIVGHTRYKAAKKLGLKTIPAHYADLDEQKAKAYRLADNKASELATWDFFALEKELAEIDDFDMTDFGFLENASGDLDELFVEAEEKPKEPKKVKCPHCGEWLEV